MKYSEDEYGAIIVQKLQLNKSSVGSLSPQSLAHQLPLASSQWPVASGQPPFPIFAKNYLYYAGCQFFEK